MVILNSIIILFWVVVVAYLVGIFLWTKYKQKKTWMRVMCISLREIDAQSKDKVMFTLRGFASYTFLDDRKTECLFKANIVGLQTFLILGMADFTKNTNSTDLGRKLPDYVSQMADQYLGAAGIRCQYGNSVIQIKLKS